MNQLHIQVTTESNLFIGGSSPTFEIGGIDLYTITDYQGRPFIPASSMKGSFRRIVKECMKDDPLAIQIGEAYRNYLDLRKDKAQVPQGDEIEAERMKAMQKRFDDARKEASAEGLLGIQGFNDTPKLIFNDLTLSEEGQSMNDLFSIDTKTSITSVEDDVRSNPRTYKTVRPGVTFEGKILFYRIEELGLDSEVIKEFVEKTLLIFNEGIYRLGNSGSRGYGKIHVEFLGA